MPDKHYAGVGGRAPRPQIIPHGCRHVCGKWHQPVPPSFGVLQMQGLSLPVHILQFERGDFFGSHSQPAKTPGHGKVPLSGRLGAIEAFQAAAQLGLGERGWDRTVRSWRWADYGVRQSCLCPTTEVEKPQKASQSRRQHMQGTGLETRSTIANETIDILRLKGLEPQGPPPKAPLQKLPNEEPINAACCLGQSSDLVKVPIILAAQPLSAAWVPRRLIMLRWPMAFLGSAPASRCLV